MKHVRKGSICDYFKIIRWPEIDPFVRGVKVKQKKTSEKKQRQ
jgi:hypothetical protein